MVDYSCLIHIIAPHSYTEGGNEWEADEMPKAGGDPWNEPMGFSLWHVSVRGDKTSATIRITAPAEQDDQWQWLLRR